MIDALIRWSLANRLFVLIGAAALVVWGGLTAQRMPVDVFPDLSAPTVTIVAEAHGMAPEEVERLVVFPLESALNSVAGVRRVRSSTSVGVSVLWVEFEWGADLYRARQLVGEKLQLVQPSLPPEVPPPQMGPITSIMGEIAFIGLSGGDSPMALRTLAEWEVKRRLLAVPGVAYVAVMGGGVRQFQVVVRPADLMAHKVSLADVVAAVRATNENTSAGFYDQGGQTHLIYGVGRVTQPADIGQAVVKTREGPPVRVLDVADVQIGAAIKVGNSAVNGGPGVVLALKKQPSANTLALTRRIDAVLTDVQAGLPEGVTLHPQLLRQADFIQKAVDNVSLALRDGALLVILIVGVFLLSGRATLITALAIPLSLLCTVLVLNAFGATLDTMTLGGMAIAVGALVDDAIIDVENVVRRLRERGDQPIGAVVFAASKEIRGSIVFATAIIVLVFLPLFFLHGVEGRLLAPLGVAYVVALATSLLVALTITPVLCALLLPNSRAVRSAHEPIVVRTLRRLYDPLLARAIRWWPVWVAVSLIGVAGAGFALSRAGRTFLPEFNEGALTVAVTTFPGTGLEVSDHLGQLVERIMLDHPEVASTARRTGRAEGDEHTQAIHASEIEARLEMQARPKAEFMAALRADLAQVPGVNVTIGQPISHRIDHMISGTKANIAVKIFGADLAELRQLAEAAEARMKGIPGLVDLSIEDQATMPLATVRFDRPALARYGLTVRDVAQTIETAFYGQTVSRVLEGAYAFDLVVRYPDAARADLGTIGDTLVPTPRGAWVPLSALARVHPDRGPNQISRESGQRKIVVMANVGEGYALGDVVDAIRGRLAELPRPPGYYITYGGQFEAAEAAGQTLMILGGLVVLGIFLLLVVALSSIRDAALVMLNLPLALIGGVVGVYLSGNMLSIASIIGFITLFGIAARNGIMLVTHIRHLITEEGVTSPVEAVLRGASERLAPILMTALASGLGLLPLAAAAGQPGSEIQAPMALVILCGLGTATLLNMVVVPAVMLRFGSVAQRAA